MTLKVSLEALTSDARQWERTAGVLASAATASGGLELDNHELSWAAGSTGLDATYKEICLHVTGLLREGALETDRISVALEGVRRAYEDRESATSAALVEKWQPTP